MRQIIRHSVLFLSVILFASACSVQKNPVSGNQRLMAYSWSQEVQIGQEVDREMVAEFGLYDDETVANYITELGEKILAESHMRRESTDQQFRETEFYFRVLDSPVVNAFALPGGYVYFTRGLMAHMNNEAQLAVVVGHEIGHVAARHASQRALRQQFGQIAILGGAILGQEFLGLPGESILNLSSQAAQLIFLSYSRDAERESDRLGVEYTAMAGYAAEEGAAFFTSLKRISEESGQAIPTMLSSHPDPGEREQNIPRLAEQWRERGYEQNIRNQEEYLSLLEGMVFGEDPRQGFQNEDQFVHPELEFQFPIPGNWQLINQPQQVVLVSDEGDGVIIFRIDGESESAEQSVRSFIQQDGISVNSQNAATSSDEYTAYYADITVSQQEGDLRAIIYSVEFDGRVYRFVNYTSPNRFSAYESALTGVPGQFDRLTDQELLNIQPARIQLVTTDRSDTFRSFLPDELPMNLTPERLAIINQVHLDDTIEAGTTLKIPSQ
ncbi:peptidase M48 [Rhodohalobacter sp. SW132]|uniref:M48 family metalloprotease n=1 Tax=Rhodohalobacter sp. SW132 TaxID=2293433 RepID=UPI000E24B24C|nr:M48 family metalloprotease [Rhodohalobacter sp. SW132]REL33323.1 peptidase M48 [Rhodohalobacter sp. SW132]